MPMQAWTLSIHPPRRQQCIHTMKKGAMIQLTTILNPTWIQSAFCRNDRCRVSYRTLHKIGYIITNNPTAFKQASKSAHFCLLCISYIQVIEYSPIGIETPTNFPRSSAGPVLDTKFPRIIPTAIARKIQIARKRSRMPNWLKAEVGLRSRSLGESLSLSVVVSQGVQDSRSGQHCWCSGYFSVAIFVEFAVWH